MNKKPEEYHFTLAEYRALREEILKRVELEYQIIYVTLLIFFTICGFALPNKLSEIMILYPVICIFLTSAWVNSDFSIVYMALYIKDQIEAKIGDGATGWEHYLAPKKTLLLSTLSVGGTLIITSLFAIGIGISFAKFDPTEIVLLILSMVSLAYSITLLVWYHFKRKRSHVNTILRFNYLKSQGE